MMLDDARELKPLAVVYDCMDELSAFRGAPPQLIELESKLMETADLVFTGGHSLYEAKRSKHLSAHPFPSSVDVKHFGRARKIDREMPDQQLIGHPRIGFAGVIDERLDIELLDRLAALRPDWQFVMIGPVVKISEDELPQHDNIHYLGMKPYDQLPEYMARWDVAIMPFALNESTKYISPTKTPEYLAAGLPVVSTAITDVVRPYGEIGLVRIASSPDEFAAGIEAAMQENAEDRIARADEFLVENSWDKTFGSMCRLIDNVIMKKKNDGALACTAPSTGNSDSGNELAALQGEVYV